MSWLENARRNLATEKGKRFAKATVGALTGNLPVFAYNLFKGFTAPSATGWGSPIQKTGATSVYDIQNTMQPSWSPISPSSSGLQSIPRSAMIPSETTADLAPYVQDFVNTFGAPSGSGLQMPQEEEAQAPQQAPPPVTPRITPTKMPVPSDLDFITAQLDPYGQSAYQSRSEPKYVNPMTANSGYFDMNKAGTVGGKWIEGVGWMTDAARMAGLKPEDLEFQAMMNQRIAGMYA